MVCPCCLSNDPCSCEEYKFICEQRRIWTVQAADAQDITGHLLPDVPDGTIATSDLFGQDAGCYSGDETNSEWAGEFCPGYDTFPRPAQMLRTIYRVVDSCDDCVDTSPAENCEDLNGLENSTCVEWNTVYSAETWQLFCACANSLSVEFCANPFP